MNKFRVVISACCSNALVALEKRDETVHGETENIFHRLTAIEILFQFLCDTNARSKSVEL